MRSTASIRDFDGGSDPAKAGLYYRLQCVVSTAASRNMPEVTPLSPELSRSVSALARALVAASRGWSLYPPEHPAVKTSIDRLRTALAAASSGHILSFGVTPETLLIEGLAVGTDAPVAEAAHWLHQH